MKDDLTNVLTAIRAEWSAEEPASKAASQVLATPFVTIARQCGAGGSMVAHLLAQRLNRRKGSEPPWRAYDRELVEKVAEDHELSTIMLETLADDRRSWLSDTIGGRPSELALLRRVTATIRALAGAGRCIIVGRGGVLITRDMPGGLHVHLVAPLNCRVQRKAEEWGVSEDDAEAKVREIDENRRQFYRRYFPNAHMSAETFAATFNTEAIPEDKQVELLLALMSVPST